MDVQALTFVKLVEGHLVKFNPDHEDEYYKAATEVPWCMRITCRAIARAAKWLQNARRSKIVNSRRAVREQKVKAR